MAIIDELWELAQDQIKRPQMKGVYPAFTRYIDGKRSLPDFGFCVAYRATQGRHGKKELGFVIDHAKSNSGVVGGWYNQKDKQFYFDSVRIYHTRESAVSAAIKEEQYSIYDLSKKVKIDVMDQDTKSFLVKDRKGRRFSFHS